MKLKGITFGKKWKKMLKDMLNDLMMNDDCWIFGSYIYKFKLNGDTNYGDIDIASPFLKTFAVAKKLESNYNCQILGQHLGENLQEIVKLKCPNNVMIDLQDQITIGMLLGDSKVDIFKVVMDKNGVHNKQYSKFNKRQCKFLKREKDRAYFNCVY